jgi:hypothetical protein
MRHRSSDGNGAALTSPISPSPDRTPTARRLPRYQVRCSRHTEGHRRRPRSRGSGPIPVSMVGRLSGQRTALRWKEEGRGYRHRRQGVFQARWKADRGCNRVRQERRRRCHYDPGATERNPAGEGPDGIVFDALTTDRADADCGDRGGALRDPLGKASSDSDFDDCRPTRWQAPRYAGIYKVDVP